MQDARVFDISTSWISHEFSRVAEEAGLKDVKFHDTRRTFISRALRAGAPEDWVRRVVGHRTHEMISRYAVFGAEFGSEMIERVAKSSESGHKSGHIEDAPSSLDSGAAVSY